MRIIYFGCIEHSGHSAWEFWTDQPAGYAQPRPVLYTDVCDLLGMSVDATLAPSWPKYRQGAASLHHIRGWTVLAWWDMTVDSRPASNSALLAEGMLDMPAMLGLLHVAFPTVSSRQPLSHPITLCPSSSSG